MSELDKWAAICKEFNTTLEALDYLERKGSVRCEHNFKVQLYAFFEIDTAQLERERRALLESLQP